MLQEVELTPMDQRRFLFWLLADLILRLSRNLSWTISLGENRYLLSTEGFLIERDEDIGEGIVE